MHLQVPRVHIARGQIACITTATCCAACGAAAAAAMQRGATSRAR